MSDRRDRSRQRRRRSHSRSRSPHHHRSETHSTRARERHEDGNLARSERSHSHRPDLKPTRAGGAQDKSNYERTGKLAADLMTKNGVVLKYAEPRESCMPDKKYRFHVFKGVIPLHAKSNFLAGRDPKVADILLEHESCSKQHAVIQHRQLTRDPTGLLQYQTFRKPYILDLGSANGTTINGLPLEASRYYELKSGDLVQFGVSSREYIFLAEEDVKQ